MGKLRDKLLESASTTMTGELKVYANRPLPSLGAKSERVGKAVKGSPLESVIQKQILDWCKSSKQYVRRAWRNNTQGRIIQTKDGPIMGSSFSTGTSDILGWLAGGIFLAIEVKRPGGYITPQQREFIDSSAGDGCCAMVATSLDDVIRKIEEVLRLAPGTIPRP